MTQHEELLRETRWLRNLTRSLVRDPAAAEDLAQDTTLSALQHAPATPRSLRGWLTRVARNLAKQEKLRGERRAVRERNAARDERTPSASDCVERFTMLREVAEAVLSLDEPYRTTLLLRFWEDLPPRAIAKRMGVPVETVRTRNRRALDLLRRKLDRRYGSRAAWIAPLGGVAPAKRFATAVLSPTTLPLGVLLMSKKIAGLIAILAIVSFGIWFGTRPGQDSGLRAPGNANSEIDAGAGSEQLAAKSSREVDTRSPAASRTRDRTVPPSGDEQSLRGIVQLADGTACNGAWVTLWSRDRAAQVAVARAGSNGEFTFQTPEPARYELRCCDAVPASVRVPQDTSTPVLLVLPGKPIEVTAVREGAPLSAADVFVSDAANWGTSCWAGRTDDAGRATIYGRVGTLVLGRHPEHGPSEESTIRRGSDECRLDFGNRGSATLRILVPEQKELIPEGALVRVVVTDLTGQRFAIHRSLEAAADVTLRGLSAGTAHLLARTDGAAPLLRAIEVPADRPRTIELRFTRGASIHGVVRNQHGSPLARASITVRSTGSSNMLLRSVLSRSDGTFALPFVPALTCIVYCGHATAREYASRELSAEDLVADLRWDPVLSTRKASVTGTVVDSDGDPVQGVLVRLHAEDASRSPIARASTSESGAFALYTEKSQAAEQVSGFHLSVLDLRRPGLALVVARHGPIALPCSELRLVLENSDARLLGRALNSDGQHDARVGIGIRQPGRTIYHELPVQADGSFDSGPIPGGAYDILALHPRGAVETLLRSRTVNGTTSLGTLTYRSSGRIEVLTARVRERLLLSVVDENHAGVAGAFVLPEVEKTEFEVPRGLLLVQCRSKQYATVQKTVSVGSAPAQVVFDTWRPGYPLPGDFLRTIEGEGTALVSIFREGQQRPTVTWKGPLVSFRENGGGTKLAPGTYQVRVTRGQRSEKYDLRIQAP